jgi:hypothetical protein
VAGAEDLAQAAAGDLALDEVVLLGDGGQIDGLLAPPGGERVTSDEAASRSARHSSQPSRCRCSAARSFSESVPPR